MQLQFLHYVCILVTGYIYARRRESEKANVVMQTVMQDLQLHLDYVTIYAPTCGKRNWKYNLQFYLKIVHIIKYLLEQGWN